MDWFDKKREYGKTIHVSFAKEVLCSKQSNEQGPRVKNKK